MNTDCLDVSLLADLWIWTCILRIKVLFRFSVFYLTSVLFSKVIWRLTLNFKAFSQECSLRGYNHRRSHGYLKKTNHTFLMLQFLKLIRMSSALVIDFFHNRSLIDVSQPCAEIWGICYRFIAAPFVCSGMLQLPQSVVGGTEEKQNRCRVRPSLTPKPPPPSPFRCDRCCCWLLGDHIPGTKRAQLVWTGLSETTSCSGWKSLPSMQAFNVKKILVMFEKFPHWRWSILDFILCFSALKTLILARLRKILGKILI